MVVPVPCPGTDDGDAGLDLFSASDLVIEPGRRVLVPNRRVLESEARVLGESRLLELEVALAPLREGAAAIGLFRHAAAAAGLRREDGTADLLALKDVFDWINNRMYIYY